jgi:hypothetical protein
VKLATSCGYLAFFLLMQDVLVSDLPFCAGHVCAIRFISWADDNREKKKKEKKRQKRETRIWFLRPEDFRL